IGTIPSIAQVSGWLRVFVGPDQVTELRALGVSTPSYRRPHTEAGVFDGENLELMAKEALRLTKVSRGGYFVPNPLKADLLGRRCNRVDVAESDTLASDDDVLHRNWLLLDADPVRLDGISATNDEKAASWKVTQAVRAYLDDLGCPTPVLTDSGNGYHQL